MHDTDLDTDSTLADPLSGMDLYELFDALPDALLLVNDRGRVLLANSAAQHIFGYGENELCKLEVEMLIPSRFREHHRSYLNAFFIHPQKRAMGDGRGLVLLRQDGQELMVDIGLSPITLQGSSCVLVSLHPANRRHQAEQALRTSEERLLLAKEAAGLGIFDYDCHRGVIHCDKRLCELWGSEAGEVMTHEAFLAAIHSNDRLPYQVALEKAMNPEGDGRLHMEFRVINAIDNIERWIVILGRVHFESGVAKRLVGIVRDIAERKMLEKNLLAQRAEAETFFGQQVAVRTASAIAHQLNSPLTAISIYSEVALRAVQSGSIDSDKVKHALESCVTQAQFAGRSLHELLAFLQKGETKTEALNINEVVMAALAYARDEGSGEFTLSLDLQPDLPTVRANRMQIQKVILNLMKNAAEAIQVANVNVSAATIAIRTENLVEKSVVMVTVQDNGPGFDQETVKHIFEPFFTTKPTGIGIGLPICRALVEANGGYLWVDTDYHQGARFHFTLPFAQS